MQALSDILILDLSRGYPGGSIATRFLADFGAEVIRIDPPPALDPRRGAFPRLSREEVSEEKAAAFNPNLRNKRSMVLNLRVEEGREVLYKLARKADVLVENNRPGVMKSLKADYDTLKEINPRLVYMSVSGYGQDGPYSLLPGHDPNYIAIAGVLDMIGPEDGPPVFPRNYIADVGGAGFHAVIGLLLALMARERTGRGQFVDVSYLEGSLSIASGDASSYFLTGEVPHRGGGTFGHFSPLMNVFQCKDGEYITVGNSEPHLWQNFLRALGREDLIPCHPATASAEEQTKAWGAFREIFLTRNRDEWWQFLKDKNTCVAPVYHINETVSDPHILARGMVAEIDDPKLGKVRQVGIPFKFSDTPGKIRSLGVKLGTHTQEILASLGYTKADIDRLRAAEAIS